MLKASKIEVENETQKLAKSLLILTADPGFIGVACQGRRLENVQESFKWFLPLAMA
jgi:hypothetical protein